MTTISLLTDFGLRDGNVGVMKAVIWGIVPDANIADLSHLVAPQNIPEASFTLLRSAFYFPTESVHIVVVDPGVGTSRKPIALKLGSQFFVGPDNGVFTGVLEHAEQKDLSITIVQITDSNYWRADISAVFHGRDIFAPVGAHLAAGIPIEKLGNEIKNTVRIVLPNPKLNSEGWRVEVTHIDHFGNIYTNLRRDQVGNKQIQTVSLGDVTITGLVQTFGDEQPGELIALYSSTDYLMISQVNGNAGKQQKVSVGDVVEVKIEGN